LVALYLVVVVVAAAAAAVPILTMIMMMVVMLMNNLGACHIVIIQILQIKWCAMERMFS